MAWTVGIGIETHRDGYVVVALDRPGGNLRSWPLRDHGEGGDELQLARVEDDQRYERQPEIDPDSSVKREVERDEAHGRRGRERPHSGAAIPCRETDREQRADDRVDLEHVPVLDRGRKAVPELSSVVNLSGRASSHSSRTCRM